MIHYMGNIDGIEFRQNRHDYRAVSDSGHIDEHPVHRVLAAQGHLIPLSTSQSTPKYISGFLAMAVAMSAYVMVFCVT